MYYLYATEEIRLLISSPIMNLLQKNNRSLPVETAATLTPHFVDLLVSRCEEVLGLRYLRRCSSSHI